MWTRRDEVSCDELRAEGGAERKSMNPFRQNTDGSLVVMEELGASGLRDRGSSLLIIAQIFDWVW
jgi:hypothetical protein